GRRPGRRGRRPRGCPRRPRRDWPPALRPCASARARCGSVPAPPWGATLPPAGRAVNLLTAAGIAARGRSRMPGMDMSYTPEEAAFRARVRAWRAENVPAAGSLAEDLEAMRAWQRKLHAAGLLAVSWVKEDGGGGGGPRGGGTSPE